MIDFLNDLLLLKECLSVLCEFLFFHTEIVEPDLHALFP